MICTYCGSVDHPHVCVPMTPATSGPSTLWAAEKRIAELEAEAKRHRLVEEELRRQAADAAEETIDCFLEFRDNHDHDEEDARVAAINECYQATEYASTHTDELIDENGRLQRQVDAARDLVRALRRYYDRQRLDQQEWLHWLKTALDAYDAMGGAK